MLTNIRIVDTLRRMVILAINPGGGSTKVAVFRNKKRLLFENVQHPATRLARYKMVLDQYRLRKDAVLSALDRHKFDCRSIGAIVSRGGPLQPLAGGVYRVTIRVVSDIRRGRVQTLHPSLLGPLVAHEISEELAVPAYFVDPESTDEFWEVSRVSGLKGIERKALSHALSCRTVARAAAKRLKKRYERCSLVVAHLGTGITVAAHVHGRQVDASNANAEGAFSPQRTGTLPLPALVRLCFSGRQSEREVLNLLQHRGGLVSYFGTDDVREIELLVAKGNRLATRVYGAMIYQIAKEIGAYVAVCRGKPDAIILTGGLAGSKRLVTELKKWVRALSPRFFVYPGDEEMSALAGRLLAMLNGEEKLRTYEQEVALRR